LTGIVVLGASRGRGGKNLLWFWVVLFGSGKFYFKGSKMKNGNIVHFWLLFLVSLFCLTHSNLALAGTDANDQIHWLISMQDLHATGLVESYEDNGDTKAWIHDQALAIMAFTAAGEEERARDILSIMRDLQLEDKNDAWVECYDANDPNDDAGCDKYVTGPITWMVMAINFYECRTGDANYASMAQKALGWLDTMRITNEDDERYGSLGYSNIEPYKISTEHNHDAYSAYYWRGMLDANDLYLYEASLILDYLREEMWAPSPNSNGPYHDVNIFWEGFGNFAFSTDPQSWGVLSLGEFGPDGEEFYKSLDWLWYSQWGNTRTVQDFNDSIQDVNGFKSGTGEPNDYVWVDGTEHVVAAFYSVDYEGYEEKGDFFHTEMGRIVDANGGLVHSFCQDDPDTIRWPENYRHNYVASAAWYYFNEVGLNPFNLRPCSAECQAANVNETNRVNFKDFGILALDWLEDGPDLAGDINGDGSANWRDLALLSTYWMWDCNN